MATYQYLRKQVTHIEIGRIIEATDQGESHRSIGKGFKDRNSTANRLVKKYQDTGKSERFDGSGRKPKTHKRESCFILKLRK